MPGEDQERFEDYLELEHYIEELQAGHIAHPPRNLTPTQARIYRMAALFRSASPDATMPRPEFVEDLRARLLALDQEDVEADTLKLPAVMKDKEPEAPSTPVEEPVSASAEHPGEPEVPVPPAQPRKGVPRRASFFSRRSLLAGSAVAAASLVVGGSIGAMAERSTSTSTSTSPAATSKLPTTTNTPASSPGNYGGTPLVLNGALHKVGTLDQIGEDAVRFTTDTIVGYVIRVDEDEEGEKKGTIIAMSASCTHMGCLIQWQSADRAFHCPCHGGVFTEYGKPSPNSSFQYLTSLPRMTTVIQGNEVYVLVPKS